MADLSQDIKISCHNSIIKGKMSNEGHPWRNWKITLVAMDGDKEVKGRLTLLLDHVDYILHPTFKDPRRVATKEPYPLQEKGWGEFDMRVVLYFTKNLVDPQVLLFDLNFAQSNYSTIRKVDFPNAPPEFAALLQKTPSRIHKQRDDVSSQEDDGIMSKEEEEEEEEDYYEKTAITPTATTATKRSKPPKTAIQKKQRVEKKRQEGGSGTSSESEHDDRKRYNAAKKKPVSTHHQQISSTKKSTVLKQIKSEEASPNSIPSTPNETKVTSSSSSNISSNKKRRLLDEVHIYSADDLDRVSPVHSFPVDDDTRRRWKIPKCNMKELAKRIMNFNGDQMKKFQTLLIDNLNDDMDIRVNAENKDVTIDLYSLGASFLQKLWEFTEELTATTTSTTTLKRKTSSSANHEENHKKDEPGDTNNEEEEGEVFEQGEYHSDEEVRTGSGNQSRPNGYKYMEESDLEEQHHPHVNEYHDSSDMDIQDYDE